MSQTKKKRPSLRQQEALWVFRIEAAKKERIAAFRRFDMDAHTKADRAIAFFEGELAKVRKRFK
jgi:hypothetical protein